MSSLQHKSATASAKAPATILTHQLAWNPGKKKKVFELPRTMIDEEQADHHPSMLSIKAPFPKSKPTEKPTDTVSPTSSPSRSSTVPQHVAREADAETRPDQGSAEVTDRINQGSVTPSGASKIGRRQFDGDSGVNLWDFNAWDNVEWNEEQECQARQIVQKQSSCPVPHHVRDQINEQPSAYWNTFYDTRKDSFFKDRAWLRNEFASLDQALQPTAGPIRIVELGCGPGNTAFPILSTNQNPDLFLYAMDYSPKAVDLLKNNPLYESNRQCCQGLVWDMSSDQIPGEIERGSIDLILMIFCFSALHPRDWSQTVKNVDRMLKPGGKILFRDYGRFDLAQLRMKGSRLLEQNFYIRGDGTRVYFFDQDQLARIMRGEEGGDRSGLEVVKLVTDRRLLLNRARRLKMYRVWVLVGVCVVSRLVRIPRGC